jgi:predicted O-methyltransferase YrrM
LRHRRYRAALGFEEVGIEELLAGAKNLVVDLRGWDSDRRAGDFVDSLTIASIARALEPATYWEIGTGDGRTALLVARNTPAASCICTIDPGFPQDAVKGSVFRGQPEANKIRQWGDYSSRFDFGTWTGKTNLVFVDGSHAYSDVLADSEIALKLLAPGGWILWHDVAEDTPDVPRALKQFSHRDEVRQIAGTRYAVFRDHRLAR